MIKFVIFFLNFFLINLIFLYINFFIDNLFRIRALVTVSGKPPLLVIITAHPLAEASKLVLPNGSSHLEQATAILVFLNILNTFYDLKNLKNLHFYDLN